MAPDSSKSLNNHFDQGAIFTWQNGHEVPVFTIQPSGDRLQSGFWLGDGVFETLLFDHGNFFAVDRHVKRLERAAIQIGIETNNFSDARADLIWQGLSSASQWFDEKMGQVRITLTSAGDIFITGKLHQIPLSKIKVMLYPFPKNEGSILSGAKTLSYGENSHLLRFAKDQGFDDAIFLNSRGEVVEAGLANIIAFDGKKWLTPDLSSGCLAGITRELLVEFFGLQPISLSISDLLKMKELALISSLREVAGISQFQDVIYKTLSEVDKLRSEYSTWRIGNDNP